MLNFFFLLCWIYRLKFYSLHICNKTSSKGRIAHFFSCGSLHCHIYPNTDLSDFRPAWSWTQQLSDPPGMAPAFQPLRQHYHPSDMSKVMLQLFSHFLPIPARASQLGKVTQVRVTTAGMCGPHKPSWSCSKLDSHKSCRWYTHQMSLQVMWHEPSPVCALGYQKHLPSFNKPWNSFTEQRQRTLKHECIFTILSSK